MLKQKQRVKIVQEVRNMVQTWYDSMPGFKGSIDRYCVFWAGFTVAVLQKHKIHACIQAGSMQWRHIRHDQDDGVSSNAWGYRFEWNNDALRAVIAGELPEMHVWAGIPNEQGGEIIDLTTGFIKDLSAKAGYPWTAEYNPPPYLWVRAKELPEPAYYYLDRKATEIATKYFMHFLRGGGPMVINFGE